MLGQPSKLSAGKVISQPLSRGSFDCVPYCPCSLRWPCNDKVASLAAQRDTALSPIMKYISLLHLRDITLSLVRRNLSGRASFLYIASLPSPLVQTQLFLNESNSVLIMSHNVKHLWNMTASTARSMAVYSLSPDPQTGVFFWKSKWRTAIRVHFWGHIC